VSLIFYDATMTSFIH